MNLKNIFNDVKTLLAQKYKFKPMYEFAQIEDVP